MSKLTKFFSTRAEFLSESDSGSIYYRIGNKKIRIANHLSANASQFALNILTPNNSNTQYVLAVNNKVFVYNTFTELKPFLINWCIIMQSSADIAEISNESKVQELEKKISILKKEISALTSTPIVGLDINIFSKGQKAQINNFIKEQNKNNKK